jgi:carbon monoxide dehydrogenase subunit G
MRIESTYAFSAAIERVYAALTDPDELRRIIPGCERLIQFGPPADAGGASLEARLRLGPRQGVYTAAAALERVRQPTRLGLVAEGAGPMGPFTLRGSIDLVAQNGHTLGAFVWDLTAPGLPDEETRHLDDGAGTRLLEAACERLASRLRSERMNGDGQIDPLPILRADTRRGKIILLTEEPPAAPMGARLSPMVRASVWAGAGLLVGVAIIALGAGIARRWGGPPASE